MLRVPANRPSCPERENVHFASGSKRGRRIKMAFPFSVVPSLSKFWKTTLEQAILFGERIIFYIGWAIPAFAHALNMKKRTLRYKKTLKKLHRNTG